MISNLLLLPFPLLQALLGFPEGSGLFVEYAKSRGLRLTPSEKTIRKILYAPGSVGNSSRSKFQDFITNAFPKLATELPNVDDMPERLFVTFSSIQWRSALKGLRISSEEDFFPETFDYIEYLINLEDQAFQEMLAHKTPEKKLEAFLESLLSRLTSSELDSHVNVLLADIRNKSAVEVVAIFKSHPSWQQYMIFSMVSLLMRMLAHGEHEWSRSFESCVYESPGDSYVARLLPILGEDGELVCPIRRLLERWRELHQFSSWEQMADSLPGDTDIADKKRKLMGWLAGNHVPESGAIEEWLHHLVPAADDAYLRYLRHSLFEVAAFMARLLNELSKSNRHLTPAFLVRAFGSFNRHFAELSYDAPAETGACQGQSSRSDSDSAACHDCHAHEH